MNQICNADRYSLLLIISSYICPAFALRSIAVLQMYDAIQMLLRIKKYKKVSVADTINNSIWYVFPDISNEIRMKYGFAVGFFIRTFQFLRFLSLGTSIVEYTHIAAFFEAVVEDMSFKDVNKYPGFIFISKKTQECHFDR